MKTIRRIISALAVVAVAACAKVQEVERVLPSEGNQKTYPALTFTASMGSASKTTIGEDKSVSWAAGDCLTVYDAEGNSETFTVEEDCDKFTFTSSGKIGVAPYYAVAGYGKDVPSFDTESQRIVITRPATTTEGSFGEADLIASTSEDDSFTFHHVFAILKMSVSSDEISSISFSAEGISATGNAYIGFDEEGEVDVTYDTTGNEVTIENISGAGTYYLAVNPGTYDNFTIYVTYPEQKMKIVSETGFTASTSKMVNFGTLDGGTPASTTWELVTDASTLAVGDQIIIAANGSNYALSTTQNTNNRGRASITKSSDKASLAEEPSSDVQILTLAEGSSSGSFALSTGSGYLTSTSSRNNSLTTATSISANSSWTITVSDGVATITGKGTNTNNVLKYSGSAFACYSSISSTGQDVAIYKKVTVPGSGPQMTEVSAFLDETVWGVYDYTKSTDVLVPYYQFGIRDGEAIEGRDQYAISGTGNFSSRMQCLRDMILASVDFSTSAPSAGNTYSVTCLLYGIDNFNGSYTKNMIVKKAENGALWLLEDGGTLGMIIPSN